MEERVAALAPNREAVLAALEPLGTLGRGVAGGDGAIYLWARLPPGGQEAGWEESRCAAAVLGHPCPHLNVLAMPSAHRFSSLMPKLLAGCDDDHAVIEWLVRKHGVCVIPGTACGTPGHIRVAYANLPPEATAEAARRLRAGLEELVAGGFGVVQAWLDAHRLQGWAAEQAAAAAN